MFVLAAHLIFFIQLAGIGLASGYPAFLYAAPALYVVGIYLAYRRGLSMGRRLETFLAVLAVPASAAYTILQGDHPFFALQYWLGMILTVRSFRVMGKRDYAFCFVISAVLYIHMGRTYNDLPFLFVTLLTIFIVPYALFYYLACFGGFEPSDRVQPSDLPSISFCGFRYMTGVSLSLIVLTSILFLAIPRPSNSSILGPVIDNRTAQSGFADRLSLGSFNRIVGRRDVVMTVETDNPALWRAGVLDYYKDGQWSEVAKDSWLPFGARPAIDSETGPTVRRRFNIFNLELTDHRLFTVGNPVRVDGLGTGWPIRLHRFYSTLAVRPSSGAEPQGAYELVSSETGYIRADNFEYLRWRVPGNSKQMMRMKEILLLLPEGLPQRVRQLAQNITRDAKGIEEKADSVRKYLQDNCIYTMEDLNSGNMDPVDFFLHSSRRGHCEYFATAMAIMLRCVGIQTRVVQGFSPGTFVDGKYVVRLSDAHLWTDVYIPGKGWKSYDPTPQSEELSLFRKQMGYFEALKIKWYVHVIDYDKASQADLAAMVKAVFLKAAVFIARNRQAVIWLFGAVQALLLLALLSRVRFTCSLRFPAWMFSTGQKRRVSRVRSFFGGYLRILERLGYRRFPGTTPNDLLSAMERDSVAFIEDARLVTDCFYRARFGGEPLTADEVRGLRCAIRRIRRSG